MCVVLVPQPASRIAVRMKNENVFCMGLLSVCGGVIGAWAGNFRGGTEKTERRLENLE